MDTISIIDGASKMHWRWSLIAGVVLLLSGCGRGYFDTRECDYWRRVVDDPSLSAEILDWADQQVFGRSFANEERSLGRLVYPGRHGAIRLAAVETHLPSALRSAELRPIYFNQDRSVAGVFLGRRNGIGIFVDSNDLSTMVENSRVTAEAFDQINGRVALSCGSSDR